MTLPSKSPKSASLFYGATEGALHVEREDALQLLEIKRGEWTLDQVKTEADRLFTLAQEAYVRSHLPPQPDMEKINKLCVEMLEMRFAV